MGYRHIARRERKQVEHFLHIATFHFRRESDSRGVGVIALRNMTDIPEGTEYGVRMESEDLSLIPSPNCPQDSV